MGGLGPSRATVRVSRPPGTLLAASPDRIAWFDQSLRLHIMSVETCQDSPMALPDGMTVAASGPSAAWSPDGTQLTVFSRNTDEYALVTLSLASKSAAVVPISNMVATNASGPMVWTPAGDRLFVFLFPLAFLYPFGPDPSSANVLVYRPTDASLVRLRIQGIPVPSSLVALP